MSSENEMRRKDSDWPSRLSADGPTCFLPLPLLIAAILQAVLSSLSAFARPLFQWSKISQTAPGTLFALLEIAFTDVPLGLGTRHDQALCELLRDTPESFTFALLQLPSFSGNSESKRTDEPDHDDQRATQVRLRAAVAILGSVVAHSAGLSPAPRRPSTRQRRRPPTGCTKSEHKYAGLHIRRLAFRGENHDLISISGGAVAQIGQVYTLIRRRQAAISVAIPLDLSYGTVSERSGNSIEIVLDLPSHPPKSPENDAYQSEDVLLNALNEICVFIGNKCDNMAFWPKMDYNHG
ncbi:hypothetical protein FIBSPDRAFT_925359 [Athelia psychrophila]|uniref:Uncharacterized protein n=1 Tax=Athelia psychrophila TaxID=1759441 RepID=A0A166UNT0_9AGAM|nr:hypothetical protein FIBSPDRAFT_925359 [Fibularhizoctonia sp. CBS 109695]